MNWIQRNFKSIIYTAFVVPILTVAFVSISHVTQWYGISNPMSWAIYLSIGVEIATLSALAAISAKMGKKVYFPFGVVTFIQFLGNIFFSYQYIQINSEMFKDWIDLVGPLVSYMGIEEGDFIGHRRFLALLSGGMLPLISLSFLHMLVKFEEEGKKVEKETINVNTTNDANKIEDIHTNEIQNENTDTQEEVILDSVESEIGTKKDSEPEIKRLTYKKNE